MLRFIQHIFSIVLITVLLGQGFVGSFTNLIEQYPLVSELVGEQFPIADEETDPQELPTKGMTNSGDADTEEIEEEKESMCPRYFDDLFEPTYFSLTTQSLAINDSFVTADPLEVIVPPPDQMV